MRFTNTERRFRLPLALAALAAMAACADDLPTAGGADRFPDGATPTTVEVLLGRSEILIEDAVHDGFASFRDASYLLAAEDFGGALDAHALARWRSFPERFTFSVDGTSRTDSVFEYVSGEVRAVVNPAATATVGGAATLRLWSLEQTWDSTSVTWEDAAEGEPWTEPGGTRGALLAEGTWIRGDTVAADTVVWQLDSVAVRRLAADEAHRVLVTVAEPNSRVQFSRLSLRVTVRPESAPDTTVSADVASGAQNYIFTPPPPSPEGIYRVGGVSGARTVVRFDLGIQVPGCSEGSEPCGTVSLDDVTINRAELVLDPVAVTSGFRPVGTSPLLLRRVVEPELGRLAPLGQALVSDTVSASRFDTATGDPVRLNLTTAVRTAVGTDSEELAFALLGESAAGEFGYQWYRAEPVLRVIYTLPTTPRLP